MIFRQLIAVSLIAVTAAACSQTSAGDPGPREGVGTLAGVVGGAVIGSQFGGGSGRVVGAVLGATAGGLIGNAIGRSMDDQARQQAYAAEYRALEYGAPGAPVAWRHERYYGTVTPGAYSDRGGARCREFAHTIYIDGQPETARGVACRQSDGTWRPV